jgi:histidine triad (HIT) family protein
MCIFCKIVDGEIPANKVLESDDFIAFGDINPLAKVHVLVIPKKHIESFNDVDASVMAGLTTFTQEVVKKLDIQDSGYRLITNINDDGGQEVKHLHFHILGGEKLKPLNA